MVTLGRAIGFDPKRDMPFEGDMHNALADAGIRRNTFQLSGETDPAHQQQYLI